MGHVMVRAMHPSRGVVGQDTELPVVLDLTVFVIRRDHRRQIVLALKRPPFLLC